MSKFLNLQLEAELIWSEDDMTICHPGHERMNDAFKRITGYSSNDPDIRILHIEVIKESDCDILITQQINGQQYILVSAYSGNSSIYKITKGDFRSRTQSTEEVSRELQGIRKYINEPSGLQELNNEGIKMLATTLFGITWSEETHDIVKECASIIKKIEEKEMSGP